MILRRVVVAAALVALLGSCSTVGYYWQAIDGHLEVMRLARPLEEVAAHVDTPVALRGRLKLAAEIRAFASRELGLPDNGSYTRFADIGRSFVVWNVVAAKEFSTRPVESCFLFAGCVAYRGFYSEARAREHAQSLAASGHDTHVGGVPAYSTLGWFDDPVLSTFVNYSEPELARIIFHELAHQVVYVRDDSRFNESFAVAVEEEGVRRWLARQNTATSPAEWSRWRESRQRRDRFLALLLRHRGELEQIYAAGGDSPTLREAKARQLEKLRAEYLALKASWEGFSGYDRFFEQGINNALLASIATYSDYVPAFAALIDKSKGDMNVFYAEVRALSRLPRDERQSLLTSSGKRAAGPVERR